MTSYERLELLATVADLYYVQHIGQAEIAQQLGYSRSAVSRLLTEAHEKQVVEIRIHHPLQRDTSLEMALREVFGLQAALVARRGNMGYDQMLTLLGRLGAAHLDEVWTEPGIIGLSWGTAVYEVANALRPRHMPNAEIVQMIGGIGRGDPQIDGPGVAMRVAQAVGGRYHTLNAPHIATDNVMREALLAMPAIQDTLQLALQASFAVVGIGSLEAEHSSLVRAGYLTADDLAAIRATGAVGDICGTHFDADGRIPDIDINQRIIEY
ncbi:MAG: sugar-binding domain-containing protein [Chloroflexota bacterium]